MRPDDRRPTPLESDHDPAFAPLSAAGARARLGPAARVDAGFAAELRGRLISGYPAGAYVPATVPVPAPVAAPAAFPEDGLRLVRPRVTTRSGIAAPSPRWAILAAAAVVVLSLAGANLRGFMPPAPDAYAAGAVDTTLERDGAQRELTAGTELLVGDVVETGADGGATLALGGGTVRLAAATTIEIARLDHEAIDLVQATGRAWHRVGGVATSYDVRTAEVTWTATGTAFDLDREIVDGVDQVRGVGVEHDVRIAGPDLQAQLHEGGVAVIALGPSATPDVDLGEVTDADLADPWLLANAAADRKAGWAIGIFSDRLAEASATPSVTTEPIPTAIAPTEATDAPSVEPSAEATAKPKPTADPTPKPKPEPTPKPTPKPTPPMGDLDLSATACPGSFTVLAWSKAGADRFDHYQTLRSTSTTIKPVEPPKPPAVAPDALFIEDRGTRTAIDTGLDAGVTYAYRTIAFDGDHSAYAVSPVRTAKAKDLGDLGILAAVVEEGVLTVEWSPFDGPDACFTFYKLVASTEDETPSYLDGAPYIWVGESAGAGAATVEALDPGTYHVRLQALRSSESGSLLVAQTDVATITIP